MKIRLILLSLCGMLIGCAMLQLAGRFQSGRQALLRNEPEQALPHFFEVADRDPDYVYRSMDFSSGIWTYVGRTQYALGKLKEARQSLERALAQEPNDDMARLYLGLTLMRNGEYERGVKELETAMRGLYDWLEYVERTQPFEVYWDPGRGIRSAIEKELEGIKAKDFDRDELLANAEWLGMRMEEEIDWARRDRRRQRERERDRDGRRGVLFGLGIGF